MKDVLSHRLQIIAEQLKEQPEIAITHFQSDIRKNGGTYVTVTGTVKKVDEYERVIVMTGDTAIPFDDITSIKGQIFKAMCDG